MARNPAPQPLDHMTMANNNVINGSKFCSTGLRIFLRVGERKNMFFERKNMFFF